MMNKNDKVTNKKIYNKQDIMSIFQCKSDKALKILRVMYRMKIGYKIGKEYYVDEEGLQDFLEFSKGREIVI